MVDDQIRQIRGAFHTSDMVALAEALFDLDPGDSRYRKLIRCVDEVGLIAAVWPCCLE
ncbi:MULTISPECIES: hypothetical protein [unclassified Sphingobium]|uniref:hypothetical protein n=1 Tax=unclassified Sphingobium TaxID=2611147 RepID=UPI00137769B6|nr:MULTISPECIES: hypothetical protein [unclassified Sphingobium]HUD93252.1 hypothetical protein [Sphingobium sp.]|tara:strand:+ start:6606 stop:6779 length:174 start_codon:yes stop_codon:yes gene_type:complete